MRLLVVLFFTFSLSANATTELASEPTQTKVSQADDKVLVEGQLTEEQLKSQFQKIVNSGIDVSQSYKWEFRFTAKVMASLEDFAQIAHSLNFWPVALESDVTGDKYWLYIQKTHQYNEEEFVSEVTKLFKMAAYANLDTFDGFSIDHPDTAAQ